LTSMTVAERRRILEDYLDAVFDGEPNPVADRMRAGAPGLPDDPTADQVAAWVELVELLRDPDYIDTSRRMVEAGRIEAAEPDGVHLAVQLAAEHAADAVRAGVDPASATARDVILRVETAMPGGGGDRVELAERIEAFTDRRVIRYWTLVGIVNGWKRPPVGEDTFSAWEWYAQALHAHA
jgi:hypothetical protein